MMLVILHHLLEQRSQQLVILRVVQSSQLEHVSSVQSVENPHVNAQILEQELFQLGPVCTGREGIQHIAYCLFRGRHDKAVAILNAQPCAVGKGLDGNISIQIRSKGRVIPLLPAFSAGRGGEAVHSLGNQPMIRQAEFKGEIGRPIDRVGQVMPRRGGICFIESLDNRRELPGIRHAPDLGRRVGVLL